VSVEGHDRTARRHVAGDGAYVVDDRAMPEVQSVVGADGDDAADITRFTRPDAPTEVLDHLHVRKR
jgi:hypothetical protein